MIKLYYAPNTRATRPRWMLEELSVPYELVKLDLQKGENRAPAYLAVHPLGQVPALEDGAVRVFESAAIVAWLADRYAAKGLAPALDAPERAANLQWLFFGAVTLEPQIARYANATAGPEEKRDAARAAASRRRSRRRQRCSSGTSPGASSSSATRSARPT
jgi:glutathione S-transferase